MVKRISLKIILFSIVIAFTLINCSNPTIPLVIGHRGAKGHIVENTLESIEKALELGVDGIEIDVFKCKSGELVVFHDKTLNRLTGAEGLLSLIHI